MGPGGKLLLLHPVQSFLITGIPIIADCFQVFAAAEPIEGIAICEVNKYWHKCTLALTTRGPVGLSTAERQSSVYPTGGLNKTFTAPMPQPCFKNSQGQGLKFVLPFCCLRSSFSRAFIIFFCITYLTLYHWTYLSSI